MSQNSIVISDGSGASVLTAINNANDTLASKFSGASYPGSTVKHQWGTDETNALHAIRNLANDGWIQYGFMGAPGMGRIGGSHQSKSGNYTVVKADAGCIFVASSTWTLSLPAVGTTGLNVGFGFGLINNGTGIVTIDPNGAETIDGLTTIQVPPGGSIWVHCTGSAWLTVANRAGVVPLDYKVASASAQIDFTAMIGTAFNGYRVTFTNIIPATDTADLWMRVSEDGGSTFKSGASDYRWCRSTLTDAASRAEAGSTGDTKILLATNLGTGTGETLCGSVDFFAPGGAAKNKLVRGQMACYDAAPVAKDVTVTGAYVGTQNAVNAIRFLMSTGNITSGTFALYGIRN